jgi:hypothetical protein
VEVRPPAGVTVSGPATDPAGKLAALPGYVLGVAVISAILVNPSPSESRFSMAVKECPLLPYADPYGFLVDGEAFVVVWQIRQLFASVDVGYVDVKLVK